MIAKPFEMLLLTKTAAPTKNHENGQMNDSMEYYCINKIPAQDE